MLAASPSETISVPLDNEALGPPPLKDHPADFPPGSSGSIPPADPPVHIMEMLLDIDERYCVAWQPVLELYTIWIQQGIEHKLVTPVWNPSTKKRISFDERILALLIDSEPRYQGGARAMGKKAKEFGRRQSWARTLWTRELVADKRHKVYLNRRIFTGYGSYQGVGGKSRAGLL